MLEIEKKASW